MNKLTYVTGNPGKYMSVKELFEKKNINVDFFEIDFEELNVNDIEKISKAKALEAYAILGHPCFVTDSGFYIDNYPGNPGYPGAFAKRSNVSSDIIGLLKTMENITDRSCQFIDCLTFYDGEEFYVFYGYNKGYLALEPRGDNMTKAKSNLWKLFIPFNCEKTLAEMSDEEKNNRNDGRTSATELFADWYKNHYNIKQKKLVFK